MINFISNGCKLPVAKSFGKDISKNWYVEFYIPEPESGKPKRFRKRGKINSIKDPEERYRELVRLQEFWTDRVQNGWNPFDQESPGYSNRLKRSNLTVKQAIEEVLAYKESHVRRTTYRDYYYRLNQFIDWLRNCQKDVLSPEEIKKRDIINYLTDLQTYGAKVSNRTRNNHLVVLKGVFSSMIELELFPEHLRIPTSGIGSLRTQSQRNKIYTGTELKRMDHWMTENDPILKLFCIHIRLGLRPIEIVSLRVGNYDLDEWKIHLDATSSKTGESQIKPIWRKYRKLFESLELHKYPNDHYFFTTKGKPGSVKTTRDFFTKRFAIMKKDLGFKEGQTMYSLRHTTMFQLAKKGVSTNDIMAFTGHKTRAAYDAYMVQFHSQLKIRDVGDHIDSVF